MSELPRVVQADYEAGHRIRIVFDDGMAGSVDFGCWLHGPVFQPLLDEACFRGFSLDGGTVAWPNGADIAPETLYECLRVRPGA